MKKRICQSINVISCGVNEIEIKGFNAKMRKESQKKKKEIAKQGLVMDERIRPKIGLRMNIFTFWFWESLGLWCLWGMKSNLV